MSTQIPPYTLFTQFFTHAAQLLDTHPTSSMKLQLTHSDTFHPISLSQQRDHILKLQQSSLENCIQNCTTTNEPNTMTMQQALLHLRQLGQQDLTSFEIPNESEKDKLLQAMERMNDAARAALARAVVSSECQWRHHVEEETIDATARSLHEMGTMKRTTLLEFCGLMSAAISLPFVRSYIQDNCNDGQENHEYVLFPKVNGNIHQRMRNIEYCMFRAVGYHPDYGAEEFRRWVNDESIQQDELLIQAVKRFVVAVKDVIDMNTHTQASDNDLGAVDTSVVSETHSEPTLHKDESIEEGHSHLCEQMQHPLDDKQKQALEVTRAAVVLHNSVREELLTMEKGARELKLQEAKSVQEEFLREALKIKEKVERIKFISTVGMDKQRLLVMWKVWEKLLKEHDGEPPCKNREIL